MNLDDLGLQIGSPVQIQFVDDETKRYTVHLIGLERQHALILSAGKSADTDLAVVLRDGQPIILRFKTTKNAVAFRTHIIEKRLTPYSHIHVAIPEEIETIAVQGKQMLSSNFPVTFINDDESSRPRGISMIGISPSHIMVKDTQRLADANQSVTITMTTEFAGKNNILVMDGEVELSERLADDEQQITVALKGMDTTDCVLLQGLYYEVMLKQLKVIA
ncbi:MAG: flagellar brake protein [Gammaproteobacteria bacterium]